MFSMGSIHILAQLFFCRGLVFFLLTPAAIASVAFGTIIKTDLRAACLQSCEWG